MGTATAIEWCDATWNTVGGCSIASPGCGPCYAMQLAGTRLKHHPLYAGTTSLEKGRPVFNGHMTAAPDGHDVWSWPVRWRGAAKPRLGPGQPSLIFADDMADLFHEKRPRAVIDKTVAALVHSRHIGQLLTKRADVMAEFFLELHTSGRWLLLEHPITRAPNFAPEAEWDRCIVPRLWLGISAERQREFDQRWSHLRLLADIGFTVFVSYEPAMGPLVLPPDFLALGRRAQVIAGGVSGREHERAGDADTRWYQEALDQCAGAGVAFFMKQITVGGRKVPMEEWPAGLRVREFPR